MTATTKRPWRIVIIGLSITSSWGNGHATTYRALARYLGAGGHDVLFLERDVEWYAQNRDMPAPLGAHACLYRSLAELQSRFTATIAEADLVIVGSYVPEGAAIGQWVTRTAKGVTAFYDIDTPVTLAKLDNGGTDYLTRQLVSRYHLYLSFTGGTTLQRLERDFGARMARALYCSVDTELYAPLPLEPTWDLGYLGTYSADRQSALTRLLLDPADALPYGRFIVVGAQYPMEVAWPVNVSRLNHLPPGEHRRFYNAQRYTLNLTRQQMITAGWSPSVRLFEAAACGTAIVSDWWEGLDDFLEPGREILIARSAADVTACLVDIPDEERASIGRRARTRILAGHTAAHRAAELVAYASEARALL
jgi:spore maturation protein CgeB